MALFEDEIFQALTEKPLVPHLRKRFIQEHFGDVSEEHIDKILCVVEMTDNVLSNVQRHMLTKNASYAYRKYQDGQKEILAVLYLMNMPFTIDMANMKEWLDASSIEYCMDARIELIVEAVKELGYVAENQVSFDDFAKSLSVNISESVNREFTDVEDRKKRFRGFPSLIPYINDLTNNDNAFHVTPPFIKRVVANRLWSLVRVMIGV
jgi:hypothetical protein